MEEIKPLVNRYIPREEPTQPQGEWKGSGRVFTIQNLRDRRPDRLKGASDERLIGEYANLIGEDAQQLASYFGLKTGQDRSVYGAGVSAGVDQLQGLGYSALAGVSDMLGAERPREFFQQRAENQQYEAYIAGRPELSRIEDQSSVGDYLNWGVYQIGQQTPIMGSIFAAQVIPGVGQSLAATAAAGRAAGLAGGTVASQVARAGATGATVLGGQGLSSGASFATRRAALTTATDPMVAARYAANRATGAQLGASTAIGYGALYEASGADGDPNPYAALLGAPVFGALEAAVPATMTRAFRIPTSGFQGNMATRAAKGLGSAGVAETFTELGQTALEMQYDGTLTPEETRSAYLNAALAGFVVGGAMGAGGGAISRRELPTIPEEDGPQQEGFDLTSVSRVAPETEQTTMRIGEARRPTVPHVTFDGVYVPEAEMVGALERLEVLANNQLTQEQRNELDAQRVQIGRRIAQLKRKKATKKSREEATQLEEQLANLDTILAQNNAYAEAGNTAARMRAALENSARIPMPAVDAVNEKISQVAVETAAGIKVPTETTETVVEAPVETAAETPTQSDRPVRTAEELDLAAPKEVTPTQEDTAVAQDVVQDVVQITPTDVTGLIDSVTSDPMINDGQRDRLLDSLTDAEARLAEGNIEEAQRIYDRAKNIYDRALGIEPEQTTTTQDTAPPAREPNSFEKEIMAEMAAYEQDTGMVLLDPTESELMDIAIQKVNGAPLESEVSSSRTPVTGQVTLPSDVIKSIVAMVRSRAVNPAARVFNVAYGPDGKKTVVLNNQPLQEQYGDQMREVHDAIVKVSKASNDYNNAAAQVFKDVEVSPDKDFVAGSPVATRNKKRLAQIEKGYTLKGGRQVDTLQRNAEALNTAVAQLIDVAGGQKNVQAIIAALKTRTENNYNKAKAFEGRRSLLLPKARAIGRTRNVNTQRDLEIAVDTTLSSAFAQYIDGSLLSLDTVNPKDTRTNYKEAQVGKLSPLQEILKDGGGINKILDRVAGWTGTPSAYATGLAKLLKESLNRMKAQGSEVRVGLIPSDQNPYYDPNEGPSGTIFLRENSSQEEILHETLHAALQWHVYKNPDSPYVAEISKAIDQTIDFVENQLDGIDTLSESYKEDARAVVGVLQSLRAEGRDLDAVLEMISYGTTLQSFRTVLKGISSTPSEAVASWRSTLMTVWDAIVDTLSRLLGVSNTVANNVLDNTVALLNSAMIDTMPEQTDGNKLFNDMINPSVLKGDELPKISNTNYASDMFFKHSALAKDKQDNITAKFFRMIGWDKFFGVEGPTGLVEGGIFQGKMAEYAEYIRKNHPNMARVISVFSSAFNIPKDVARILQQLKQDSTREYIFLDQIGAKMSTWSADRAMAMKTYLDTGDRSALDNFPHANKWVEVADEMVKISRKWIDRLNPEDKSFFAELDADNNIVSYKKFSDALITVSNRQSIASHKFGLAKVSSQIRANTETLSAQDYSDFSPLFNLDPTSDKLATDGVFYKIEIPSVADGMPGRFTFVDADVYNNDDIYSKVNFGTRVLVDTSVEYRHTGMDSSGGHKFTRRVDYSKAIANNKAKEYVNALRNTMAALSNFSASMTAIDNLLATQGTDSAVVYDSVVELNRAIDPSNDTLSEGWYREEHLRSGDDILKSNWSQGANWQARAKGTFVRVPDSSKEDGGNYGGLAGKIIPAELWIALNDASDRSPIVSSPAYNNMLRYWKKGKTVYNPGTHITNATANVILSMFHGIPMKNTLEASDLLLRYEFNPDSLSAAQRALVGQFMRSGAMLGNFANNEMKKTYVKTVVESMRPIREEGVISRMTAAMRQQKLMSDEAIKRANQLKLEGEKRAEFIDTFFTDMYNMGDNVFRFAAFMTKAGDLMVDRGEKTASEQTILDAGLYAKRAFIDYDIDAKAVQFLRQSFMPFVSYTYGIMPVLARIVATKPWMLANTMLAMSLADVLLATLADGDDEETRRLGPEGMEDRVFGFGPRMYWRLPMFGDADTPVYLKMGDYVPFGNVITGGLPNSFAGQDWWPAGAVPSNPLLTSMFTMFGYDAFTGNRIHSPTDNNAERAFNVAKSIWTNMAPPTMSQYNIQRFNNLLDQKVSVTGRDPSAAMFLFGRIAGLKLEDFDVHEQEYYRKLRQTSAFRDYRAEINKAKREEYRKGYPDYEALNDRILDLHQRMMQEYREIYKLEE